MYLLDTNILLWFRLEPTKLSKSYIDILTNVDRQKCISTISLWEISLKFALGKLELGGHTPEEFLDSALALGLIVISPEPDVYASFHQLQPIPEHRDPFDRMLIWQAIKNNLTLLSADHRMVQYKNQGLTVA